MENLRRKSSVQVVKTPSLSSKMKVAHKEMKNTSSTTKRAIQTLRVHKAIEIDNSKRYDSSKDSNICNNSTVNRFRLQLKSKLSTGKSITADKSEDGVVVNKINNKKKLGHKSLNEECRKRLKTENICSLDSKNKILDNNKEIKEDDTISEEYSDYGENSLIESREQTYDSGESEFGMQEELQDESQFLHNEEIQKNEESEEDILEDDEMSSTSQSLMSDYLNDWRQESLSESDSKQNTTVSHHKKSVQSAQVKWVGETNSPKWNKMPKINDKFPDLPVPANINGFGDCLKTRLGRFHYGLTLTDPPCQFYHGVLKGATGQTLAAMFGDVNLFSKFESISLNEIGHFAMDTTFRVLPNTTEGINQVFTISLIFQNQVFPLWFAVTSCSSTELYKRIIIEFQQYVLDWPFLSVLVDNDPAVCKAVQAVFPDVEIYGSWFHYCYSIWKEVSLNNLMDQCRIENSSLMTAVKLLMVIPFLPATTNNNPSGVTMVDGLDYVKVFTRENNLPKEFNKVLDFIAAFWFNKVKADNFTVFGKHSCSINYIEVHQLALLAYMKPNGNVWTLIHSFQSVARATFAELNRYLNGKRLSVKKNRVKKFNIPIRQNIKKLMSGTLDLKTYLEKSTIYLEEMLDIFLHPLYPTTINEKTHYTHTKGWKIKICST